MLKTGSSICPTLTQPKNVIDFTQPHEPAQGKKGTPPPPSANTTTPAASIGAARAGVPMMTPEP